MAYTKRMKIIRAFKTLINELLGTRKEYQAKDLCVFTCKICDWWLDKQYLWTGIVRLPFYAEETIILVEGDASAPFPEQLSEIQVLLRNWQSMAIQLDNMMSVKSREARKEKIYASWEDQFYPYTITVPYSGDGWEIVFYRKSGVNYSFTVVWKNNTVQKLLLGGMGV